MNEAPSEEDASSRERQLIDEALSEAFDLEPAAPATRPKDSDTPSIARLPTDSFTGYEIVGEIHRGGQGVVYESTGSSIISYNSRSFARKFVPNPITMPQNAPLAVIRVLHTLINATGPHEEANSVAAK